MCASLRAKNDRRGTVLGFFVSFFCSIRRNAGQPSGGTAPDIAPQQSTNSHPIQGFEISLK